MVTGDGERGTLYFGRQIEVAWLAHMPAGGGGLQLIWTDPAMRSHYATEDGAGKAQERLMPVIDIHQTDRVLPVPLRACSW